MPVVVHVITHRQGVVLLPQVDIFQPVRHNRVGRSVYGNGVSLPDNNGIQVARRGIDTILKNRLTAKVRRNGRVSSSRRRKGKRLEGVPPQMS